MALRFFWRVGEVERVSGSICCEGVSYLLSGREGDMARETALYIALKGVIERPAAGIIDRREGPSGGRYIRSFAFAAL